jgi:hypothetical protein
MKLAALTSAILKLARRTWANRDSTICPIHHGRALATGHGRDDGTQCEYEHYVAGTGKQHYFWVSRGQQGVIEV